MSNGCYASTVGLRCFRVFTWLEEMTNVTTLTGVCGVVTVCVEAIFLRQIEIWLMCFVVHSLTHLSIAKKDWPLKSNSFPLG